jgi:hypothetical protein
MGLKKKTDNKTIETGEERDVGEERKVQEITMVPSA